MSEIKEKGIYLRAFISRGYAGGKLRAYVEPVHGNNEILGRLYTKMVNTEQEAIEIVEAFRGYIGIAPTSLRWDKDRRGA
ncbi:MAG: hypothetical protein KAR06_08005 [Deltaproteobacteria bacterium]|nr:hypothetical protein [Deltaproteobacteria bacterium]